MHACLLAHSCQSAEAVNSLLQGIKVNVKNIDVGKARAHVSHTVPEDVLSIISGAADPNDAPSCETASFRGRSSSLLSSSGKRDPVEAEVGGHIWSRIQALGISGNVFEEGVEYINDEKEADDAMDIVSGIDPALRSGSAGGFVARRRIPVERRHWVASKQGHYLTEYGIAYVHTNGAVAMFQHGRSTQCRCGALHTP